LPIVNINRLFPHRFENLQQLPAVTKSTSAPLYLIGIQAAEVGLSLLGSQTVEVVPPLNQDCYEGDMIHHLARIGDRLTKSFYGASKQRPSERFVRQATFRNIVADL
jgi:hypothetical protein